VLPETIASIQYLLLDLLVSTAVFDLDEAACLVSECAVAFAAVTQCEVWAIRQLT